MSTVDNHGDNTLGWDSHERRSLRCGDDVDLDAVVYFRKICGGMQKATLRLLIKAARKLLEKPTIRVNWSSCQIREVHQVLQVLAVRPHHEKLQRRSRPIQLLH